MTDFLIRPETPADYREVETLTRDALRNAYRPDSGSSCPDSLHNAGISFVLHDFRPPFPLTNVA